MKSTRHDADGCCLVPAVLYSRIATKWPETLEDVALLSIGEKEQDYIVRTRDGCKCRAYYIPFFDCFFVDDLRGRVY